MLPRKSFCALVCGQRTISGSPPSDQPMPRMPLPAWLPYSRVSVGVTPAIPGGTEIGISYVAAPPALTANLPGSDICAEAPPALTAISAAATAPAASRARRLPGARPKCLLDLNDIHRPAI